MVLSINHSANVFVFTDFHIHHKDWLTYSAGTDSAGHFCHNISFSYNISQFANFPTWILECDSNNVALLNLFLSSDPSICSAVAFRPLGNSDHVAGSATIDFPSNLKGMLYFVSQLSIILVLI